ncbi:hypothetical protein LNP17_21590 [Klebsiella variicola subsp. variicola]|nr:hypothetical protein [Klebsiella variicola subsp. variicola]
MAIIIFQDPTFLSLLNLSNILTQSSVRIIIALGVAGLIVTQGTDPLRRPSGGTGGGDCRHHAAGGG